MEATVPHQHVCFFLLKSNLFCFVLFVFPRQGFSVALEPALELALVAQAGLELTKIHLPDSAS